MGTLIPKFSLLLLSVFVLSCKCTEVPQPKSRTKIENFSHEGVQYRVVYAASKDIKLILNDKTGEKLGTFEMAREEADRRFEKKPRAIMNAGIFESGSVPTGISKTKKRCTLLT